MLFGRLDWVYCNYSLATLQYVIEGMQDVNDVGDIAIDDVCVKDLCPEPGLYTGYLKIDKSNFNLT